MLVAGHKGTLSFQHAAGNISTDTDLLHTSECRNGTISTSLRHTHQADRTDSVSKFPIDDVQVQKHDHHPRRAKGEKRSVSSEYARAQGVSKQQKGSYLTKIYFVSIPSGRCLTIIHAPIRHATGQRLPPNSASSRCFKLPISVSALMTPTSLFTCHTIPLYN